VGYGSPRRAYAPTLAIPSETNMVRIVIDIIVKMSLNNPLVVILLAGFLAIIGIYSFFNVNVEAYPDPAPAIVEVVAQFPGASAEEVERQVTIPLEVTFAGMPGLRTTRSQSLFGLSDLKMNWHYGYSYEFARQEVINRLATISQPLPPNVSPGISPESPTGEIYRYILKVPKDSSGRDLYTLNDLKAHQDWVLEREFRTVPRIVDVTSFGGTVRRYEVRPDPDRLRRYGVTLPQLQNALTNANATVGGDYVNQGQVALTVRSVGLFGGGADPVNKVLGFEHRVMEEVNNQRTVDVILVEKFFANTPAAEERKQRLRTGLARLKVDPPLTPQESADLRTVQRTRERIQAALTHLKVEPALSEEEAGFVRTIERVRVELAGRDADPPLTREEDDLRRTVDRMQERLAEGLGRRQTDPPLTEEERDQIDAIRRRAAFRAAVVLRAEEQRRVHDIRHLVIASTNNQPVRVEDVVQGGRNSLSESGAEGVVVSHQTRLGQIGYFRADRERERGSPLTLADIGHDESDKVQCIVLMRKNEDTIPALKSVKEKVEELNDPANGRMLPGVEIEPYYDRTDLLNVTTRTVTENLVMGILLVTVVLFMFINNVRAALIVAINIPLALAFAFSVLFLRGKSANLLSIGAVDFGIIVDSSVIMVENIYRHLAAGSHAGLPMKDRILKFVREIDNALLFSSLIMVCAFVPLFTMKGPEGQLFGPMAQTYGFALIGALVLALTLTPVLCMLMFKKFEPVEDNFLVRFLKGRYLWQLGLCLKYRWVAVTVLTLLVIGTACLIPSLGNEFMPELEEGNLWIRCTAPLNQNLERNVQIAKEARRIVANYPEVEAIISQSGRPDDGTDTCGYYNTEYFVPLRPEREWPKVVDRTGLGRILGAKRARTKAELVHDMNAELEQAIPGVVWNFSQNIRDNVMEAMSGIKGDNSVKIFGPDIDDLEKLATKVKNRLEEIKGVNNVGIFHIRGQSHLEFRVDPEKCERWGVMTADVNNVVTSALGATAQTRMVEGEKLFDIAIRWPKGLRSSETSILDIPVDIVNNQVVLSQGPGVVPQASGTGVAMPSPKGTQADTSNPVGINAPRLRLRDLVSPVGEDGSPDLNGQFERHGASDIYREDGKRMIAVKFSVGTYTDEDGKLWQRDLGSAVREARAKTKPLFKPPYRSAWSGEFEEMEDAQSRLMWIIPISLALIFMLLYIAFRSFLDSIVVLSNVLDLSMGGIWALYLTGMNFSVSAAVGFVSLFGVAIMDGLLMISSFNQLRAHGVPLREAIMQGAGKRVRPVTMTALTAILGLLPAALSTQIGSQTQKPLAVVVVGGMLCTLFLTRYLMPVLYSFYGHREPPEGSGDLAH
jgi:cobalt-zinc-cadmium resistance protein CzcA